MAFTWSVTVYYLIKKYLIKNLRLKLIVKYNNLLQAVKLKCYISMLILIHVLSHILHKVLLHSICKVVLVFMQNIEICIILKGH